MSDTLLDVQDERLGRRQIGADASEIASLTITRP